MFDPGYDLRTIVTAAVVIPVVSFTAIGFAKLFGRGFRRFGRFAGKIVRVIIVESIEGALAPRFDDLAEQLADLVIENDRSHGAVVARLEDIEARLALLETRRRDDRTPYNEEG
jgi:hypothetical protein